MKLARKYQVEKALYRDDNTRPLLSSAWLDVEGKCLIATNGRILAVVPVDLDDRDRTGSVPAKAVTAARLSKASAVCRRGLVVIGDMLFRRGLAKHPAGTKEQRKSLAPTFKRGDAGTVTFGIDATYLMRLAQALGSGKEATYLAMTVKLPEAGKEMVDPILVTGSGGDGATGIIMPARIGT